MDAIGVLILYLFTGSSHMHQLAAKALTCVPSSSVLLVQNVAKSQFASFNFRLLPEDSQIIVLQATTFLLSHNLLVPDRQALCNLLLFLLGDSHPLLTNTDLPSDPFRFFAFFQSHVVRHTLLPSCTSSYPLCRNRYEESMNVLIAFISEVLLVVLFPFCDRRRCQTSLSK